MLQKSNVTKTVEVFFIHPHKRYYLTGMSRSIGLAHTSVKRNLDKLIRQGLIVALIEKRGKRNFPFYVANSDSKIFRRHKAIYNLSSIIDSGIIEFIEEKLSPKSIVLFGSYQRGEDAEESDIDLFVECGKEELNLAAFEKKLKRKIQLHFKENFVLYPKELKNSIINGIALSGFLEGYK
jgi:predicted nucleotidyltransferase